MAEHFEDQRLVADVVDESARDRHHEVLFVVEPEGRPLARILQWFSGEGFFLSVEEADDKERQAH